MIEVHTGDFRELSERLAGESVDLVLTDPPYPGEYLPLWEDLARMAARVLKPDRPLVALSGQFHLPDVLNLVTPHLTYLWTLAYLTPGGQSPRIWPCKVNTFWKPVLLFVKGRQRAGEWAGDVVQSPPNRNDKRYHRWGQNVVGIRQLVERFSRPGDLVLDPFLGGGTTAVACLQSGRHCVGFEVDPEAAEVARQRVANAQLSLFVMDAQAPGGVLVGGAAVRDGQMPGSRRRDREGDEGSSSRYPTLI